MRSGAPPPGALLLDLDGTLVDRDRALSSWVATLAIEAAPRARLVELDRGGHGPRRAFFEGLAAALDVSVAYARARFLREMPSHVTPRPDVTAWLDAFDGPKIVVTNGSSRIQRAKVDAAGLASHIDAVITSEDHGAGKPSASIFRAAVARAGVPPGRALMIGDHPVHDVLGAGRAGLAVHMVRSRWFPVPPGVPAIDSVCEVAWR